MLLQSWLGIIYHLPTVVYFIYQLMWSLWNIHTLSYPGKWMNLAFRWPYFCVLMFSMKLQQMNTGKLRLFIISRILHIKFTFPNSSLLTSVQQTVQYICRTRKRNCLWWTATIDEYEEATRTWFPMNYTCQWQHFPTVKHCQYQPQWMTSIKIDYSK